MGDNLLRQQLHNFRRRRDRAKVEVGTPRLYERPEIVDTVYQARPIAGERFREGDVLYAMPDDSQSVVLARGHRKVARINGEAGRAFGEALAEPDTPGVVQVRIVSLSPLSGTASIQVI